jgi:hypothetical protein
MKLALIIVFCLIVAVVSYRALRGRQSGFVLSDTSSPASPIRDTLFGDMPLETWAGDGAEVPWSHFAKAKHHLNAGEKEAAIAALKQVVSTSSLEPRHYLQAWHFLRPLGVLPDNTEACRVLGVVVEVPVEHGLDIVAAYPDHSARYFNFSGAGVIWEHPDSSLDPAIDRLISTGQTVVDQIGPWGGPRPGPPPKNHVRLSFLTAGGLCFGQGPFGDLTTDPKGGAVITAATELMQALMAKSQKTQ